MTEEKLTEIRSHFKDHKIDGFIVPRTDEYQGEYVAPYAERLAWLTGFTGSAGYALVLKDKAVVMSDGRYTIQLEDQVDKSSFMIDDMVHTSMAEWLKNNTEAKMVIGFDPKLHTKSEIDEWQQHKNLFEIKAVNKNLVDQIWKDQPEHPKSKISLFSNDIAGLTASEKIDLIAKSLIENNVTHFIMSAPESIAWLLNVRAEDIAHIPVPLSHVILEKTGRVIWFIDEDRISDVVKDHLGEQINIYSPSFLKDYVQELDAKAIVGLDYKRSPYWFYYLSQQADFEIKNITDPCIMPRACKTNAEQKAIKDTHIHDGCAIVKFLHWFDEEAPKGNLDELSVIDKLESIRQEHPEYKETSFDTIAGWAANGAVIHYRADSESNKAIKGEGLLLLDSGGQYGSGTTDITRTIPVGTPTDEMIKAYTLVLKGHIALAKAKFPEGTNGAQIDTFARSALWEESLDYDHGTGHGVGCYLSVHEEAANISKKGTRPLMPGMLLSNEPGFYKKDAFGIRIENLVFVREAGSRKSTEREQKMLGFETITLAPIDRRLIDKELMTINEINWLSNYHKKVFDGLKDYLEPETQMWLSDVTKPL